MTIDPRWDFALWMAEYLLLFVGIFAAMFAIGSFIERYVWARPLIKNNSRANDRGDGLELETLMAANAANGWGRARLAAEPQRKAEVAVGEVSRVWLDRSSSPARIRN